MRCFIHAFNHVLGKPITIMRATVLSAACMATCTARQRGIPLLVHVQRDGVPLGAPTSWCGRWNADAEGHEWSSRRLWYCSCGVLSKREVQDFLFFRDAWKTGGEMQMGEQWRGGIIKFSCRGEHRGASCAPP